MALSSTSTPVSAKKPSFSPLSPAATTPRVGADEPLKNGVLSYVSRAMGSREKRATRAGSSTGQQVTSLVIYPVAGETARVSANATFSVVVYHLCGTRGDFGRSSAHGVRRAGTVPVGWVMCRSELSRVLPPGCAFGVTRRASRPSTDDARAVATSADTSTQRSGGLATCSA